MPVGGAAPRTFAPGCKNPGAATESCLRTITQFNKSNRHGSGNYSIMKHSNIYRPRHLVTENIYQISKFNSCSMVTTLQDLATIGLSKVFAGFNIIVTGLVSCLINASECKLNAPLRRRKFKNKSEEGHSPSPDPLSLGRGYPSQKPYRRLYGTAILAPSALDPGWTNFANLK